MKITTPSNHSFRIFKLLPFFLLLSAQICYSQTTLVTSAEAESGVLAGNVTKSTTRPGYSGTGYVTTFTASSDKVTVNVTVDTTAYYQINIRYCASWGNKNETIYTNANSGTTSVLFPQNSTWGDVNAGKYLLNAGANTITLQSDWGWIDIDKFSVYSIPAMKHVYSFDPNPVTPTVTAPTQALYDYLVSNFNVNIISGQTDDYYDKIKPITGRSPLLRDFEFQHYTQGYSYLWSNILNGFTFGAEDSGQTQKAIDWYNSTGKKGIVSFQWHWHSPTGGKAGTNTFYTSSTTFDITKAVISGTPENALILQDIDAIAIQLKRLQAAGVPVLFRPLHEASGGWFWWGAKGPSACLSLFNIVFDRITNLYGLNNLLWVWSSPEPAWYPGNTKIDIVGHDSYPGNYIYDVKKNDFDLLYTLGNGHKIIAMAENGPIPNPDDCLSLDAPWSYFMSWSNLVSSQNTTQHIIDVFSNLKVLTLENVTATNELSLDKTVYTLYPNPAKGIVSIKGPEYFRLEVIDLNGKIVYSTSQANNFIQTAGIANGVYIVRITAGITTFQQKLVVCN